MGVKDAVTKAYMQDEETFADAFNFDAIKQAYADLDMP